MRCFVLGNGRSRLCIQPSDLIGYGKIYGCNALYREFDPDFLIFMNTINESRYEDTNKVFEPPKKFDIEAQSKNSKYYSKMIYNELVRILNKKV